MSGQEDQNVANKTIGALNNIPFESIIGGPLSACVKAQAEAAVSTVNFIEAVGLQEGANGTKEAVYVVFSYLQNGRRANISVPLLALVPIPYISINNIELDFKVTINGTEESHLEDGSSVESTSNYEKSTKKGGGWLTKRTTTKMSTSISSKRDSKATQDSKFSIESTIDVHVQAGQESMPSGMAKILAMLNDAVDVVPEKGDLIIDGPYKNEEGKYYLTASYKNPYGEYSTKELACDKGTEDKSYSGDGVRYVFAQSGITAEVKAMKLGEDGNPTKEAVLSRSVAIG